MSSMTFEGAARIVGTGLGPATEAVALTRRQIEQGTVDHIAYQRARLAQQGFMLGAINWVGDFVTLFFVRGDAC